MDVVVIVGDDGVVTGHNVGLSGVVLLGALDAQFIKCLDWILAPL